MIKICKDVAKEYTPKTFIEHSNTLDDVYNKCGDCNPKNGARRWIHLLYLS